MLPGRRSPNGSLFIQTDTPNGSQVYSGGLALTPLGANYVLNGSATNFVNGFMVTSSGQLCIAPGGVIAKFAMGLPFTADGRLVTQLNQAVIPSDPFVGGVRVGPLGGVYTIDLTPPPFSAFSTGFDEGFA